VEDVLGRVLAVTSVVARFAETQDGARQRSGRDDDGYQAIDAAASGLGS
jgi:hypothetical protein